MKGVRHHVSGQFSNCFLKCLSNPHGVMIFVINWILSFNVCNHISWDRVLRMWGGWGREKHPQRNPVQNYRIAVFCKTQFILSLPPSSVLGIIKHAFEEKAYGSNRTYLDALYSAIRPATHCSVLMGFQNFGSQQGPDFWMRTGVWRSL